MRFDCIPGAMGSSTSIESKFAEGPSSQAKRTRNFQMIPLLEGIPTRCLCLSKSLFGFVFSSSVWIYGLRILCFVIDGLLAAPNEPSVILMARNETNDRASEHVD